jgi:hypothetical protein
MGACARALLEKLPVIWRQRFAPRCLSITGDLASYLPHPFGRCTTLVRFSHDYNMFSQNVTEGAGRACAIVSLVYAVLGVSQV